MPANAPYAWETPQDFQQRMMRQQMQGQRGMQSPVQGPMVGMPQQGGAMAGGIGGPAPQPGPPPGGPPAPQGMGPPASLANNAQMGPPSNLATPPPQLSEADLDMIAGMPGQEMELDAMGKQLAQAQALRDTAMPEGRSGGGIYTAANPLEFVGAGLKQYAGIKKERELEKSMGEKRGKLGKASAKFHKAAAKEGGLGGLFDKDKKKKPSDED